MEVLKLDIGVAEAAGEGRKGAGVYDFDAELCRHEVSLSVDGF